MRNPYLNRVAIKDPSQFFGRRREMSKIFSRLGASRPQSISIVGERRIGKSSLLYHISHPQIRAQYLDGPELYTFALIDFQQKRSITQAEFFGELLRSISRELRDAELARLSPTFDSIRAMLERFREEGRRLIILLDEFDAVTANPAFDLEFYSFLRSLANNYDVAYVTGSSRDLQELCRSRLIADSPFFNIFTNVFLRAFTHAEALELISVPSAEAGLPLEGYARRIIQMSGHFPYLLQIACSVYFDHLSENGGRLDREEVEAAFLDEAKGQFRFMWDHMDENQRRCIRDFISKGSVEKEQEHIYEDLKRAGYFIEDERGPRIFSYLFESVISRPRKVQIADAQTPLIEPQGHIGRFQIVRALGAGGMGEVFEAYDTQLHRTVAIKVLAPKYVEDETIRERFLREARMTSKLNHPNIAIVYEIGQAAGTPYIVMEYVEGEPLSKLLSSGPLDLKSVIEIGRQAADALSEAHERGIVHRDIKPSNIMITPRGRAKILDFGLAKPLPLADDGGGRKQLTESGILIGTINYMSPEQASGKDELTASSDLFSLGVVLYEATTGRLPFDGETYLQIIEAITRREPAPIKNYRPEAPAELIRIIERMLKKSPSERYNSAAEVSRDLAAINLNAL
jgi:serine/threonine-protein kinase